MCGRPHFTGLGQPAALSSSRQYTCPMDDFLARRHDAYTTGPDEIAAIVGRVTRQPIAAYEKRVRGYDNEVYAAPASLMFDER